MWVCSLKIGPKFKVENLMRDGGGRILAIQALRNSTMSATFFGTMSSTIGFFVGLSLALVRTLIFSK